jgi:acetyltransferase-like isoleucine patch superfamily enzyme
LLQVDVHVHRDAHAETLLPLLLSTSTDGLISLWDLRPIVRQIHQLLAVDRRETSVEAVGRRDDGASAKDSGQSWDTSVTDDRAEGGCEDSDKHVGPAEDCKTSDSYLASGDNTGSARSVHISKIGNRTEIGSNVFIGDNVIIGSFEQDKEENEDEEEENEEEEEEMYSGGEKPVTNVTSFVNVSHPLSEDAWVPSQSIKGHQSGVNCIHAKSLQGER